MEKEIPLRGGNITGVIRIGQTIHRTTGSWSTTVHGLLQYLEAQGFEGVPRFLGLDQQGREILSFIEGEVGNYPLQSYMWSDKNVMEVAYFLRRYHDATVGYIPSNDAIWQFVYPDHHQHEVICHNDFAPYNMVYRDQKTFLLHNDFCLNILDIKLIKAYNGEVDEMCTTTTQGRCRELCLISF